MERNWYIICTKTQQEKKVMTRLAKKKIESFCPFTNVVKVNGSKSTTEYLPVFRSFVFAFISEPEIKLVKRIPYIVNLAYWKSKPVTLSNEEIDAIKMMAGNYINIKLEKSGVKIGEKVSYIVDSTTSYSSSFVTIKPSGLKIVLPTLGYTMIAERANVVTGLKRKKFTFAGLFSLWI